MVEQKEENKAQLTKEETEIYDRQIRLWGVEAQQRLRKARVLLVGLNGLGNEVCKNILLAGVHHLTLLDHTTLTKEDVENQFLSEKSEVGKNKAESSYKRARELNPMVDLVIDTEPISRKPKTFFQKFDVICMTGCCVELQVKIDEICREFDVKFLTGNVFGYFGFMFEDLGQHKYMQEITKANDKTEEPSAKKKKADEDMKQYEEKVAEFCSFAEALMLPLFKNKSLKQAKQISKAYLVVKVMHEYHDRFGEYPDQLEKKQDLENLITTRDELFERLGIDNDFLSEELLSYSVGSVYPVNAIIGGVISQEVIKAVSGKDEPHNNFFFYDGVSTTGLVHNVSPAIETEEEKVPNKVHEEIIL